MPDRDTLTLVVLVLLVFGALLAVLTRLDGRRRPTGAVERRRWHAAAARKSANVALVWVGLLVVALLLGRILLGVMAVAGIVVFGALAVCPRPAGPLTPRPARTARPSVRGRPRVTVGRPVSCGRRARPLTPPSNRKLGRSCAYPGSGPRPAMSLLSDGAMRSGVGHTRPTPREVRLGHMREWDADPTPRHRRPHQ